MSVLTRTADQPTAQDPGAPAADWVDACPHHRLEPGIGVAVLLPDGHQVALFATRDQQLFAVDNLDPHTGATVISRGIVGDRAGEPTVASPMLKHVFSLATGQSLDSPDTRLNTWPVRVEGQNVQVATAPHADPDAPTAPASDRDTALRASAAQSSDQKTLQDTTRAEQGT